MTWWCAICSIKILPPPSGVTLSIPSHAIQMLMAFKHPSRTSPSTHLPPQLPPFGCLASHTPVCPPGFPSWVNGATNHPVVQKKHPESSLHTPHLIHQSALPSKCMVNPTTCHHPTLSFQFNWFSCPTGTTVHSLLPLCFHLPFLSLIECDFRCMPCLGLNQSDLYKQSSGHIIYQLKAPPLFLVQTKGKIQMCFSPLTLLTRLLHSPS